VVNSSSSAELQRSSNVCASDFPDDVHRSDRTARRRTVSIRCRSMYVKCNATMFSDISCNDPAHPASSPDVPAHYYIITDTGYLYTATLARSLRSAAAPRLQSVPRTRTELARRAFLSRGHLSGQLLKSKFHYAIQLASRSQTG